jgi:hypothetical protein
MVFLNRAFYENIGIPKSQISGSFIVFLKEYVKKIIEHCVQMEPSDLNMIDIGGIPIREDKNIYQYILLITEDPEKSRLIHDKIYGMIYHFAGFVCENGKKCSFDSVMELANSGKDIPVGIIGYFLKPMDTFYKKRLSTGLNVSVEAVYIHRETFYLYAEICCSNIWTNGSLSGAFKELVYLYFFKFMQHLKNWISEGTRISEDKFKIIMDYISENYSEDLGKHMWNQILKYQESSRNWVNINIYKIYDIPEQYIEYCKVIIQYLLVEFIYTAKCIAKSNEKRKIYPVDLFLGMEDAELLELPVFWGNGGRT